jgi:hypothetical protein
VLISDSIFQSVENISVQKYRVIDTKLKKLDVIQTNKKDEKNFFARVVSTNSQFTNAEITLLSKGLKYNPHHKPRD